jgi:hypothetical protein
LFENYATRTLREAFRLVDRAHRLLVAPDRWTRHVWARDRRGREVDAASVEAVRWCAGGAVISANGELYGGRGDVEIPVDPRTREAIMVRSPRRVVAALEALGIGFMQTSPGRIQTSAPPKDARATRGKQRKQHPTLLATDINDLPLITHPHVVLALAWTMAALHDEIERRAPRRESKSSTARSK